MNVELLELLLQACALVGVTGEDVVQCCLHFPFRFVDGVGGEAKAGELPCQRTLKFCRGEVWQIAEAVLASPAEKVFVDLVGVILRFGEDEAVFTSSVATAAAVQHAAGEVIMDAITLSPFHSSVDDLLDPVEEFRCDERVVSARVDVSFECDHPEVVRITEDLAKLTARQRTLGPLAGLASRESLLGEQGRELGGAVLAGRVLLEGPADEGRTLLVEADCVDQAPVEVLAVVDVSELRAADGATVLRLIEQLLFDVFAALADLDFVHDVGDGFHGFCHVAVPKVLLC